MEASILAGNAQRVAKVKLETSHRVIRASKQTFADDRWMEADALRSSLSRLRERQRRQEQEYLDAAQAEGREPEPFKAHISNGDQNVTLISTGAVL